MVSLVLVFSLAGIWLGTVDGAEVRIVLIRGNPIIFKMLINVLWLLVLNTAGAAVNDFLL